jgi:DNA-binding Lrp family transcriptional regulator
MDSKELENEILYKIQTEFPLVKEPFAALAKSLEIEEDRVIKKI